MVKALADCPARNAILFTCTLKSPVKFFLMDNIIFYNLEKKKERVNYKILIIPVASFFGVFFLKILLNN